VRAVLGWWVVVDPKSNALTKQQSIAYVLARYLKLFGIETLCLSILFVPMLLLPLMGFLCQKPLHGDKPCACAFAF
jgi:hypothetical protein